MARLAGGGGWFLQRGRWFRGANHEPPTRSQQKPPQEDPGEDELGRRPAVSSCLTLCRNSKLDKIKASRLISIANVLMLPPFMHREGLDGSTGCTGTVGTGGLVVLGQWGQVDWLYWDSGDG